MNNKTCSKIEIYIGNAILMVFIIIVLIYLYYKIYDTNIYNTNPCSTDEEIKNRQLNRGIVASIIVAIIVGTINSSTDHFANVDPSTSTALLGMVLGGTIGFIFDILLGSDNGWRITKHNKADGINYAFGTLATPKFQRYLVTLLLDIFISLIIFSIGYTILLKYPYFRCYPSITNGIISAIISILTFQIYANSTRFLWAYPDINSNSDNWIPSFIIFICVIISGVIFMKVNTSPGNIPEKGINHPDIKFYLFITALLLITFISLNNEDEATPKYNINRYIKDGKVIEEATTNNYLNTKDIINKNNIGKVIFIIILCVTIFGTFSTSTSYYKSTIMVILSIIIIILSILLFIIYPKYSQIINAENNICK
tara:strand:+ start:269 stop:1375 length:1107 start_codon:yes stop_codon:yes gene_type:complete